MSDKYILKAIVEMIEQDMDVQASVRVTGVQFVPQGGIVSFGVTELIGEATNAHILTSGAVSEYLPIAFFINKKQLKEIQERYIQGHDKSIDT